MVFQYIINKYNNNRKEIMYNNVVSLKYPKIVFILLCLIFVNFLNINKCFSNVLSLNNALDNNEIYKFVNFELLFGKKSKSNPSEILLGLKVNLSPKWKIYWRNPGDAGLPPEIKFDNANNIKSVNLLYPNPERFNFFGIETLGYEKKVIFPLKILLKEQNQVISGILEFNAQVCSDICVPVTHKFNLNKLNLDYENKIQLEEINRYKNQVPKLVEQSLELISSNFEENYLKLTFDNNLNIIPYDIIIEDSKGYIYPKPDYSFKENLFNLSINLKNKKDYNLSVLKFTFLSDNSSYEASITNLTTVNHINNSLGVKILLISFIGGFILNFMPCVLPVLSLKMIQLVSLSSKSRTVYNKKLFFNILGILTAFLLLGIITYFIKATGNLVGWGIQFQNRYFLIFMIILTSFFALNLLGIFHYFLPSRLLSIMSYKGEGFTEDFLTGMFLTFLATPCTAPFVGTAIGFALSGGTIEIFSILLIMGFGLSFPLILFGLFPKIISFIPKPGNWLIIFKKLMALLLLITSLWLINVLVELVSKNSEFSDSNSSNKSIINWNINDDINLPNELVREGKTVFIDITADWCLTCKVNKFFVIDTKEITELFKKNNVNVLRLDWTKPNEKIKQFLAKKGRYGIPFNEIYSPSIPNGKIFPELLTLKVIKEYLDIAK